MPLKILNQETWLHQERDPLPSIYIERMGSSQAAKMVVAYDDQSRTGEL
jgi:hypothetical protein